MVPGAVVTRERLFKISTKRKKSFLYNDPYIKQAKSKQYSISKLHVQSFQSKQLIGLVKGKVTLFNTKLQQGVHFLGVMLAPRHINAKTL